MSSSPIAHDREVRHKAWPGAYVDQRGDVAVAVWAAELEALRVRRQVPAPCVGPTTETVATIAKMSVSVILREIHRAPAG